MSLGMRSFYLTFFLLSIIRTFLYGQANQVDTLNLDPDTDGMRIENIICMDLAERKYSTLHLTTGEKVDIKPVKTIINGDIVKPKRIHTRGQSTLLFKRKSLSFKLKSKATFQHGEKTQSFKNFQLLNLAMDKYYCCNRIAFEMMETLGIFNLFYSFCELRINGSSEGVYMVIERPEDWALKQKEAPLVIRRGFNHKIDEIKTNKKSDQNQIKEYVGYYKQIYKSLNKYEGEKLYEALLEYIDINFYMKWLAFNFLIHNGDYSDEVFFYIDPEVRKYRIIPWDYDDILATTPHEGIKERNKAIGNKLLFSSEDLLDKKIATDPYLYRIYMERLNEVITTLSPGLIKLVVEKTYAELYPFYWDDNIISNVQFDYHKDASIINLKAYLSQIYFQLIDYGNIYVEYLDLDGNSN